MLLDPTNLNKTKNGQKKKKKKHVCVCINEMEHKDFNKELYSSIILEPNSLLFFVIFCLKIVLVLTCATCLVICYLVQFLRVAFVLSETKLLLYYFYNN